MFGVDDVVTAVSGVVGKVIDRIWPDPTVNAQMKTDLAKAQLDGSLKEFLAQTDLVKGQLAVNQAEATNPNLFVSGWRPYVGWVCGTGLAYDFIAAPLLTFGAHLFHSDVVAPSLDLSTMLPLLAGMLGLGYMRTQEKIAGLNPGQ